MRRYRWWLSGSVLVFIAALVAVFVFSGSGGQPQPPRPPGPPGFGPLTIVSMGDSTISGEGAGDYTSDTDGANGDWCHRSPHAEVFQTAIPGITEKINLACSGAPAAQVALGEVKQWGEASQARRLSELTRDHRIAAVVVAVGANDDPHFSALVNGCIEAWFSSSAPPCSTAIQASWQSKIDAMVPKVAAALNDIRKVLTQAGYRTGDYQMILQSYASPVGPDIPENLRGLIGCPFRTEDLRWINSTGVQVLSSGLKQAATQGGARFLDLSRAGLGHEACSGGANPDTEWFSRFSIQFGDLTKADRATHAVQSSFHPNATGHAQFGRCLTEFVATPAPSASCVEGSDGNLHSVTSR
jgi:lysophospholipase L1-like esterase